MRIGIDVGGTFTDAVLARPDGSIEIAKVRSTPDRIADGFMDALHRLLARAGASQDDVTYLAHGSTVATNAIVQRRLARTALVTNAGFRDVLAIGTQMRRNVYDLWSPEPEPVVPRDRCFGIRGRLGAGGEELEPLDEVEIARLGEDLRRCGVEAVAVMLLHSYRDARHEQQVGELLRPALPGVAISLSCEVVPEFREYLRASTTALNAALLPLVGAYVDAVSQETGRAGVRVPLHLMQSNGGVASVERARRLPIGLASSGPAAGVIGGARLAAVAGERDVLTFDMGGTTADIGLVVDGAPQLRFSGEAAGMPVNLPQIDVLCIGAGGGSIAVVDAFGALRVGPSSAGAVPGPAAYGQGGVDATVTDAHVVLGTLASSGLAGGVGLDRASALAAVTRSVAVPLGLAVEEAAAAIVRIANANMANALRVMSVARGHDARRFALVAIGGAGPMHACALADELGMPRVLVPRYPGVAAALGLLVTDVRHDLRRSLVRATSTLSPAELDARLGGLEDEAATLLGRRPDDGGDVGITFQLDMRYRGQAYNLTVPLAARPATAGTIASAEQAFADEHRRLYDYTPEVTATEIVTVRATAFARSEPVDWESGGVDAAAPASGLREVWDGELRPYATRHRGALAPGALISPFTIVEQEDATTVVPGGWSGRVAAGGMLVLEREHAR